MHEVYKVHRAQDGRHLYEDVANSGTMKTFGKAETLHEAVERGRIAESVKILNEKKGGSVNEFTDGVTPLQIACKNGYLEIAEELLNRNALVNLKGGGGSSTCRAPLHEACHFGHINIVKLLLRQSASVDIEDENKKTPLLLACQHGFEDIVTLLLQHEADLEHEDEEGSNPLIEAVAKGHAGIVDILIRKGARIDTKAAAINYGDLTVKELQDRAEELGIKEPGIGWLNAMKKYHVRWTSASKSQPNRSMLEKLLRRHDKREGSKLRTPLITAVERGHEKVVEKMLKGPRAHEFSYGEKEEARKLAEENGHAEIWKLIDSLGV